MYTNGWWGMKCTSKQTRRLDGPAMREELVGIQGGAISENWQRIRPWHSYLNLQIQLQRYYWNLAVASHNRPNWIAKWFRYHKCRYCDGRNRPRGTEHKGASRLVSLACHRCRNVTMLISITVPNPTMRNSMIRLEVSRPIRPIHHIACTSLDA